jgi:hypothetical protein
MLLNLCKVFEFITQKEQPISRAKEDGGIKADRRRVVNAGKSGFRVNPRKTRYLKD